MSIETEFDTLFSPQLRYVFDKVNAKEHSAEVIAKLTELK
jgi:hypothetical protein